MPITTSPIVPVRRQVPPGFRDLRQLDLEALGVAGSPVVMVDDFNVTGLPFPPHPHAGFAAVTYVFPDATTGLRSRSSMGDDLVVGPGGTVWSEAGSGLIHEESPTDPSGELHGIQLFVKLTAANELTAPRMLALDGPDVPVWTNADGDVVRVVSGAHDGVRSPLDPIEPFTFLDLEVRTQVELRLAAGEHLVVTVRTGAVELGAGDRSVALAAGTSLALGSDADTGVTLVARDVSDVVVMGGAAIDEPLVSAGSIIMSDRRRVADAIDRYRSGEMGRLAALGPARSAF